MERRRASVAAITAAVPSGLVLTNAGWSETTASLKLAGRSGASPAHAPTSCTAGVAGACGANGVRRRKSGCPAGTDRMNRTALRVSMLVR
jgi:hypothetical protein